MQKSVIRKRKKRLLLIFGILFLLAGAYFTTTSAFKLLAGYTMFQWDKHIVSKESSVASVSSNIEEAPKSKKHNNKPIYDQLPEKGELMGRLYIPKIDQSLPIYHGTNEDELAKGVGHFAGSVLPGEKDNSVLSGHRDSVFRSLGEVGTGDKLITTTSAGTFTFKIKKVRIVNEDDRTVIVPKPKATLTLTTCYPFNFIGKAPDRYVLVAELVSKDLNKKFKEN